jgi:hypothetical protein
MCSAILSLTPLVFPTLPFFGEKSRCSFKNNIYSSSCCIHKNKRIQGSTDHRINKAELFIFTLLLF